MTKDTYLHVIVLFERAIRRPCTGTYTRNSFIRSVLLASYYRERDHDSLCAHSSTICDVIALNRREKERLI